MSYTKYLNSLKIEQTASPKGSIINVLKYNTQVVSTITGSRHATLTDFIQSKIYDIDQFYIKLHKLK